MKILTLIDFFQATGYEWIKDAEPIKTICHYTKTRVDHKASGIRLGWGFEQTFLLKAVAEWAKAELAFEVGFGRGTGSYATALVSSIKEVHSIDLLDFSQKFSTAIGYKPAVVSLKEIKAMIPFTEKSKVFFHNRREVGVVEAQLKGRCDTAFIDGDHTNRKTILEDYRLCSSVLKPGGIILWDDYDPDQFAVKGVVDELLRKDTELDAVLIEQRGHLFPDKPAEKDRGVVLMKRGKLGL